MILFILLFGLITLITLTIIRYENFQIAGITLTPEQLDTEEILECIKKYKQNTIVIFVGFVALALLSQLSFLHYYQDPYLLTIFIIGAIALYRNYVNFQQEVRQIVIDQLLSFNKHKVRSVDLAASRNKGKSRPSSIWAWAIWSLTLIPIFINMIGDTSFTWISILTSLLLMIVPASYLYATRFRSTIISNDTDFNQQYQARYEWIKSISYLLMELAVVTFLVVVQLQYLINMRAIPIIMGAIFLLFTLLLVIFWWESREIKKLNQTISQNFQWMVNDTAPKTKFGFYHDPDDSRIFVPKTVGVGVTINIATPVGKVFAALIFIVIIGSLGMAIASTVINYDVSLTNQEIVIDSVGYDDTIQLTDIQSVKLSDEPLDGIRVHGYGGFSYNYGVFNFEDYGNARFYSTNENPYHIIIEQKEDINPEHLIFNLATPEETNQLYEQIQQNME